MSLTAYTPTRKRVSLLNGITVLFLCAALLTPSTLMPTATKAKATPRVESAAPVSAPPESFVVNGGSTGNSVSLAAAGMILDAATTVFAFATTAAANMRSKPAAEPHPIFFIRPRQRRSNMILTVMERPMSVDGIRQVMNLR